MTTPTHPRPRQVTLAAWMIMLGSVFVVATVFEMVAGLRSLETREGIESFLSEPPVSGTGLGYESVLTLLRTAGMVAAGCATAAAVLGGYVLRGHRSARLGLTVLAVPLFVSGLVTGGFMSALVAAASAMLWFSPAKEWFNGEKPPQAPRPGSREVERRPSASDDPPTAPPSNPPSNPPSYPPPEPGPSSSAPPAGPPPAGSSPGASPGSAPGSSPGSGPGPRAAERPFGSPPAEHVVEAARRATTTAAPVRRPETVVAAAILTWVFAGLVMLSSITAITVMATSPDMVFAELERQTPELREQGVSRDLVRSSTFVSGGLAIAWCVAAAVLAALMLGRRRWAARGLLVLATAAAVLGLLATLGSLLAAVPALAAMATVVLLRRPEVRAWFAASR